MSFHDGWAAINLEMPDRVPRTEYSVSEHWELVSKVTGVDIKADSLNETKIKASAAFIRAWNYDLYWNVLVGGGIFGEKRTKMGHAVYSSGGTDFDTHIEQLYADPEDSMGFDPWALYGKKDQHKLVGDFNSHYQYSCALNPDLVNMTGIYVTCMSGLIEIFGWDTLLSAAGIDPDGFGEVTNRYSSWILQYFNALAECDSPVVMVHDDIVWSSGAFLHPDWYRRFIFPNYRKCFAPLIEAKKIILYTSDGDYTRFIDDVAGCGINGFVFEPLTDMQYIAEKYGKTHCFVGNADTRVLLNGSRDDIYAEVKRCMDIGKQYPGFFMAVGNHIPSNTPVDNVMYYNEAYEKMSKR